MNSENSRDHRITRRAALDLIESFQDETDGAAMKSRELVAGLLMHSRAPLSRHQYTPGHVTCTGLVLSPSQDAILLVHHARLERWLLPGGHVEPDDASPADAARREVIEETGAVLDSTFTPALIGLDVHGIPPKRDEPFHLHHDLIFGFAAAAPDVRRSAESHAVLWCLEGDFERYGLPGNVRLAYRRFRRRVTNS